MEDRRVRQRILEAAVAQLSANVRHGSLLADAARLANCPLETAQRFFARDEELVMALYLRVASELESKVADLPYDTVARRFQAIMNAKFDLAAPYREAFAAFTFQALNPAHELGALNESTEIVRNRSLGIFSAVVLGASDFPSGCDSRPLVHHLYGLHLLQMLHWSQDRSSNSSKSRSLLKGVCKLLNAAVPLIAQPLVNAGLKGMDGIVGSLVEPCPDPRNTILAGEILERLLRHRRLSPHSEGCAAHPCPQCYALHLSKVRRFILHEEPIQMLLPAFPAKSPSSRKTLGVLPDRAEELALDYLQNICNEIQAIYAPGARIVICSDGRVFSDLVGVTDENVTAYNQEIAALIQKRSLDSLDIFGLEDLFDLDGYEAMRALLMSHYSESLADIEARARNHASHASLLNGIERFLLEERPESDLPMSKTQQRKMCRSLALQVVQRSDAWGRLVMECFPTALRLSIHPQHAHAEKIGIRLGNALDDSWITPWHGVAVLDKGEWTYRKRHEAEEEGAVLVKQGDRGYYFVKQ